MNREQWARALMLAMALIVFADAGYNLWLDIEDVARQSRHAGYESTGVGYSNPPAPYPNWRILWLDKKVAGLTFGLCAIASILPRRDPRIRVYVSVAIMALAYRWFRDALAPFPYSTWDIMAQAIADWWKTW